MCPGRHPPSIDFLHGVIYHKPLLLLGVTEEEEMHIVTKPREGHSREVWVKGAHPVKWVQLRWQQHSCDQEPRGEKQDRPQGLELWE